MRYFSSLPAFSRFLGAVAIVSDSMVERGVGGAGFVIWKEARGIFGHPEKLPPALAPSTVLAREKRQGYYANPPAGGADSTSTLLWTGSLRDSIEFFQEGMLVGIGTADERMVWQELGTATIAPRPVLAQAAANAREEGWVILNYFARKAAGITSIQI